MHLNLFIQSRGHHEASWRHPKASGLPLTDLRFYQECTARAEAGLFDSIFLADSLALGEDLGNSARTWLEPITALGALALANAQPVLAQDMAGGHAKPGHGPRQIRPTVQRLAA